MWNWECSTNAVGANHKGLSQQKEVVEWTVLPKTAGERFFPKFACIS